MIRIVDNDQERERHRQILLDKQREYLAYEAGCTCLIHHPIRKEDCDELIEIMRTGLPQDAAIAAEALNACPTRRKNAG